MKTVLGVIAALCATVLAVQDWPRPVGKVNDFASLLRAEDRTDIEAQLTALEQETSAEVALVTIRSLEGQSVEGYANGLFADWGIGKKGQDNGVLILIARDEREMRIEVGYGLEGVLPDGLAGAIIRETFVPRFRDGDYRTGIREGTTRVADIVRRNQPLTADERAALEQAEIRAGQSWVIAVFLSLFVSIGAFVAGTAAAARIVMNTISGLFFLGMALFFALLGAPPPAVVLLAVVAVIVLLASYRLGRRPSWQQKMRGTGPRASGSGWMMSGRSSGSSSSRSSSSGYGGGRSGGGGASGRW